MTPMLGFVDAAFSMTAYALVLLPLGAIGFWAARGSKRSARRSR